MQKVYSLILFLWATVFSTVAFCIDMPHLTGRVVDEAGILTAGQKESIENVLEYDTKNQVAVVVLKSLRGMEIEEYANHLFNHWGLGDKENNNGVLIAIAPNERQARIEVGYGLEHVLTDAITSQIMRQDIIPFAQKGDYGVAAFNASQRVIEVLTANGNDTLPTKQSLLNRIVKFLFSENGKWVLILLFLVIYVIITGGGATPSYSRRFGRRRSYHFGGSRSGGWFRGRGGRSGGGGASGRW
ncbi:MAG: TPM domain-containing protein [Alphaproteobacteria bacterium]|nr:TPM domain-containing protein [Alphaproteobacteria bacterium]